MITVGSLPRPAILHFQILWRGAREIDLINSRCVARTKYLVTEHASYYNKIPAHTIIMKKIKVYYLLYTNNHNLRHAFFIVH